MNLEEGKLEEFKYFGSLGGVLLEDGFNELCHLWRETTHERKTSAADLNR